MTISTVIITRNSNNDKIAMAFTGATYSELKAQSADLASTLVDMLVGKTDKVNGKVVSEEDAANVGSEWLRIGTLTQGSGEVTYTDA